MGAHYRADIQITRQEDGLWRIFVPDLKGAWVDCSSLEEGFGDIQEAIALMIDHYERQGWPLPESVHIESGPPLKASLPILLDEYPIHSEQF